MTIISLSAFYEYSREQSYCGNLRGEFERRALHEQVTGLNNRRHLNEQLKHE